MEPIGEKLHYKIKEPGGVDPYHRVVACLTVPGK